VYQVDACLGALRLLPPGAEESALWALSSALAPRRVTAVLQLAKAALRDFGRDAQQHCLAELAFSKGTHLIT
jgi:hypothetical protein